MGDVGGMDLCHLQEVEDLRLSMLEQVYGQFWKIALTYAFRVLPGGPKKLEPSKTAIKQWKNKKDTWSFR